VLLKYIRGENECRRVNKDTDVEVDMDVIIEFRIKWTVQ
jgi:hypothetical protein